jgi:galactonate dehydratase
MPLKVNNISVQGTSLRISTEEGLVGLGPLGTYTPQEFQETTRLLAGYPATAWAALKLPPGLSGPVNCALLDIVGKYSQVPVHQVLGGPTRFKVRVMARLKSLANLAQAWQQGHRAFTVPVEDPQTIAARLTAARKQFPDADFVLDAASTLTPAQSGVIAAELERFHLLWFNDPCPVRNLEAIAKIANETVTPLGFTHGSNAEFLKADAIDIVRPSIANHGLGAARKTAALAEVYYVAVAPQLTASPLETMAALHFAASVPNFFILEIPMDSPQLKVKDGYVDLPMNPGIGVAA